MLPGAGWARDADGLRTDARDPLRKGEALDAPQPIDLEVVQVLRRHAAAGEVSVEPACEAGPSRVRRPRSICTTRRRRRHGTGRVWIGLMNRLALMAVALFLPSQAFAAAATKAERVLFCRLIEASLEEHGADMGLDAKACRRNSSIRSRSLRGGVREIRGRAIFNAPGRPPFKLTCVARYSPPLTTGAANIESCH